jgi:hypothetical protein
MIEYIMLLKKFIKCLAYCYSYYAQYRKMNSAVNMMQKHEFEILLKTFRVIRTRCDLLHNEIDSDDIEGNYHRF